MSLVIDLESAFNTVNTECKFTLFLSGQGYLCNNSDWMERLDHGQKLHVSDFSEEGDICKFDEPPFDLFDRTHDSLVHRLSVHQHTIITHIQEVQVKY